MELAEVWRVNGLPLDGGEAVEGDAGRLVALHAGGSPRTVLRQHVDHLLRRGWRLAELDRSGVRAALDIDGADLLEIRVAHEGRSVRAELAFLT